MPRLDQHRAATARLESAAPVNPKSALMHLGRGDAFRRADRGGEAIDEYQRALAIDPGLTAAHLNLGATFQVAGRCEEAIRCYYRALSVDPRLAEPHYNLGNLYAEIDNLDAAISHYERAVELRPTWAEAHNNLANILQNRGRLENAVGHYNEAVRLNPHYVGARRNLANALKALNRFDEAIDQYRAAVANVPEDASTLNLLASALLVAGRLEDAARTYATAIELAPHDLGIHLNSAAVGTFAKGDSRLVRLEEFAAREETLSDRDRIALHFTLGKAFADLKDGARSFHHLGTANRIKRQYVTYDEHGTVAHFDRIRNEFSRELVQARAGHGHPSEAPIFVLGMPRSGTSLVEQILASHPCVFGAGEPNHLAAATSEFAVHSLRSYPEMLSLMSVADLAALGRTYVERLRASAPNADRIVDKMPSNFLFVGLIHLALPQARIIHVKRSAIDTCLSCFSLLFAEDQPFAYDLAELGRYYRAYETLMTHWRAVLPAGAMLEVQYEDLVADLDGQARRLIQHCGLDWNERCLSFHETMRPVKTASVAQVRGTINSNSVGRWRLYGDRLKPLLEVLGVDIVSTEVCAGAPPSDDNAEERIERAMSLAARLQRAGLPEQLERLLVAILAVRPDHLDTQFLLGNVLYAKGEDRGAARCYLKVLQLNPRHREAHNNLGNVLLRQGHADRAIACYQASIDIDPSYADAYGNLGNALLELNRLEESIEQNRKALVLKPERFGSYNNLGVAFQALGRFDEAREAFERALEIFPNEAPIHLNLANMESFGLHDRRLPGLKRLLAVVDTLDGEKQIAAHFAMAKALADLGQHDEAFRHLDNANGLKRKSLVYDEPKRLAMFENIKAKFPAERFQITSGHVERSWSPIFIVGMPRSGTTLMEQVLASHSRVFGAGELETFKELVGECAKREAIPPAYPDLMETLSPEGITELGRLYVERVRAMTSDADCIVDKMPLNFVFVGLIHLALPNARFIHLRRDPLDTCVSCYSLLFTGSQPFAYDLAELGRYYRGYETVMDHWNCVLPPGVMMDVRYEDLVADIEGVSRAVLRHCGLAWEDACLNFHDNRRTVRTASLMQVRKPLYRSSIGGWRRYARYLMPLAEALGQDVPARVSAEIDAGRDAREEGH